MVSLQSSAMTGVIFCLFLALQTTAFFLTDNATETYMSREERNMLKYVRAN